MNIRWSIRWNIRPTTPGVRAAVGALSAVLRCAAGHESRLVAAASSSLAQLALPTTYFLNGGGGYLSAEVKGDDISISVLNGVFAGARSVSPPPELKPREGGHPMSYRAFNTRQ